MLHKLPNVNIKGEAIYMYKTPEDHYIHVKITPDCYLEHKDQLPEEIEKIIANLDKMTENYPKYYTIDKIERSSDGTWSISSFNTNKPEDRVSFDAILRKND